MLIRYRKPASQGALHIEMLPAFAGSHIRGDYRRHTSIFVNPGWDAAPQEKSKYIVAVLFVLGKKAIFAQKGDIAKSVPISYRNRQRSRIVVNEIRRKIKQQFRVPLGNDFQSLAIIDVPQRSPAVSGLYRCVLPQRIETILLFQAGGHCRQGSDPVRLVRLSLVAHLQPVRNKTAAILSPALTVRYEKHRCDQQHECQISPVHLETATLVGHHPSAPELKVSVDLLRFVRSASTRHAHVIDRSAEKSVEYHRNALHKLISS